MSTIRKTVTIKPGQTKTVKTGSVTTKITWKPRPR